MDLRAARYGHRVGRQRGRQLADHVVLRGAGGRPNVLVRYPNGVGGGFFLFWGMNKVVDWLPASFREGVRPYVFVGPALVILSVFLVYPVFNTILINVTSFFRDRDVFEALRTKVLPRILVNYSYAARVTKTSATPTGMFTKKIHSQPRYLVRIPPPRTPIAAPEPPIAPQIPSARLRSRPSVKVVVKIERAAGDTSAAPPSDASRPVTITGSRRPTPASPTTEERPTVSTNPEPSPTQRPGRLSVDELFAAAQPIRSADDLAHDGIRLNCTNPGPTQTAMMPAFEAANGKDLIDAFIGPRWREISVMASVTVHASL